MSAETLLPPHYPDYVPRHSLDEPPPLFLTPRANTIPSPRKPDPSEIIVSEPSEPPETRKPGAHRAPNPTVMEWLGGSAARAVTASMLGGSLALLSAGSWMEDSINQQTVYTTALDDLTYGEASARQVIDEIVPSTVPTTPQRTKAPSPTHSPKVVTPPKKPAPTAPSAKHTPQPKHTTPPKPTTPAKPKKPTPVSVDNWPKPGTNCNYLPKHQHRANVTSAAQAKGIFKRMVIACFGSREWPAAEQLWQHESNFRPMARNPHGGACGVVQALPCSKLLRASGANSLGNTTVEKQARWGVRYVKSAYGTPTRAWRHWRASVNINGREVGNWY